jgi:chromate reductase, NAD(P)H dehydrogenase (quinone)
MGRRYKVAVIVGSLRKDSINRKVAAALIGLAPSSLDLDIVEIRHLPLYDPDADRDPPDVWKEFRRKIGSFDAVLFVTPEQNSSIPGSLKNAIDGAAQPDGESVWNSMPGAVISASVTGVDCFADNHHLRQVLAFLNVPTMANPGESIVCGTGAFDSDGALASKTMRSFLEKFMQAFARWVAAKCVN